MVAQPVAPKPRYRVKAGSARDAQPSAAYFHGNDKSPFLASWNPALREAYKDSQVAWTKAAARSIDAIHNSGFLAGAVDVSESFVVGSGLRLAARADQEALGWSDDYTNEWTSKAENVWQDWADNLAECDAGCRMTFGQMQQAAYRSWIAFGEVLASTPLLRRPWGRWNTKMLLLEPSRIIDRNEGNRVIQGVEVDGYGAPLSYLIHQPDPFIGHREVRVQARDRDGRPNLVHVFAPSINTTRGVSPLAPVLKVIRQIDQYADATLTSAMIQTIFAATIRSDISGISAFEGLMTEKDGMEKEGVLNLNGFAAAKEQWYDGAKIDLTQHGRIAHMFPNDTLEFTEAKQPGQQYDGFMSWLLREVARGAGVTYEAATGDYRGATYSSVRMAGAIEWLTVMKRRTNIIVPFSQSAYETVLEEAIGTGRLEFPGGLPGYLANKTAASRAKWTGPAQPQADDFKTARAFEVMKEMGVITLAEISSSYGRDWDDDMRQRAREKAYAIKHGLPDPWAPKDIMEVPGGVEASLRDAEGGDSSEKKDPKRPGASPKGTKRSGGVRTTGDTEPQDE
ncbi:MAG: phage portal protein [Salinarimonadaceae bacterium]|nr:MAG: phage portal protein [Salinarimonadaceae bacterium]